MKHEQQFENDLEVTAMLLGCRYYKIPDTKMINKTNRYKHHEQKRPFDGVLCTRDGNFIIECKYGNGKLLPHQELNLSESYAINGKSFVLRKKQLKAGVVYTVETHEKEVIYKTECLEDLVGFFIPDYEEIDKIIKIKHFGKKRTKKDKKFLQHLKDTGFDIIE
jgi:hypothetical protein